MANRIVNELRTTTDAVWARLSAQLHGSGRRAFRGSSGFWAPTRSQCRWGSPGGNAAGDGDLVGIEGVRWRHSRRGARACGGAQRSLSRAS